MSQHKPTTGNAPKPIAAAVARVTRTPLGMRGFAEGGMIADWKSIVGEAISRFAAPVQIKYPPHDRGDGTLVIKVSSGAMATQLQHLEPLLIQRINGYFGYRAVARVTYLQGPLPKRRERQRPAPPKLTKKAEQELSDRLSGVDDPDLRAVLERLGRHVVK